ncbi:MAG: polysaccharide pyruvyl transferase family protein [Vicinamibacterales bacterium]
MTVFCVRPKRFNLGNDAIFLGLRHLVHEAFGDSVNIVQVPAIESVEEGALAGLSARTIHEINLYGHGVIVGGGNLYENGQLRVDTHALRALRPPLMLFSLSHGRIYDNQHRFVPRTDSMPPSIVTALNGHAALSLARDEATMAYLRSIGVSGATLGGCPTLLLSEVAMPHPVAGGGPRAGSGALLSIRHPSLMSIPLSDQARLHATIAEIMTNLEADGFGPVRILCHDTRDLAFASSFGTAYLFPDDVYSYMHLLRRAPLVVSFRLHAFLPCMSFGTRAVNISYDERSRSLVQTIGMEAWDIDFVRTRDVPAAVRDRCRRFDELEALRQSAQPLWREQARAMRDAVGSFACLTREYAAPRPEPDVP